MSFDLKVLLQGFEQHIRRELRERCERYPPEFETPGVFSVLTALLARQATLALELACAPPLWNPHSGLLFLRAMADVHITLSWILLDVQVRVKQYVEHGLGQAVLQLEHLKKKVAGSSDPSRWKDAIDSEEGWIDMQKLHFLVEVNVGAWSGTNTRQMAEEARLLDFYNRVYTQFSQCAHSTWYHVGRYNSSPSNSPLTRLLWIPEIAETGFDPSIMVMAAEYLDMSFNVFDTAALGRPASSRIEDWFTQQLADDDGVSEENTDPQS
jgi:Family of unknown function (DUF5677)